MKKVNCRMLCLLLSITVMVSCKKIDLKPPAEDQIKAILLRGGSDLQLVDFGFNESLDFNTSFSQPHSQTVRTLVRFQNPTNSNAWKYILVESDTTVYSNPLEYTFLISRDSVIEVSVDLFSIPLIPDAVVNFDVWTNNPTVDYEATYGTKIKISDSYGDTTYSLHTKGIDCRAPIECSETEICTDSWWVTYVVGTGEVINITYDPICTIECPPSGGGGNGGPVTLSICNMTESQGTQALNAVVPVHMYNVTSEYGGQTVDGITIREPKNSSWKFVRLPLSTTGFFNPEYCAMFTGVRYYNYLVYGDPWKWLSFQYHQSAQCGGYLPTCYSISMSATASSIITTSELYAIVNLSYYATATLTVASVSNQVNKVYSDNLYNNINAAN